VEHRARRRQDTFTLGRSDYLAPRTLAENSQRNGQVDPDQNGFGIHIAPLLRNSVLYRHCVRPAYLLLERGCLPLEQLQRLQRLRDGLSMILDALDVSSQPPLEHYLDVLYR
jgi:hypothetical protein